ncbi:hypothetical protein THAOC_30140, partial [Thalassiosira oceanica]
MSSRFRARPLSTFIIQARFARLSGVSLKFERKLATLSSFSDPDKNDAASEPSHRLSARSFFFDGGWSSRQSTQQVSIGRRPPLVTPPLHTSISTNSLPLIQHARVNQMRTHSSSASSAAKVFLSKDAATAPVDYPTSDRFWRLPPAIAIHLSIGSGR